ncbi:MAG: hypothetical protein WCA24_04470, partial [Thiomonas sp.]
QWADPDLAQAAFHMRRLVEDPAYAHGLGQAAAAHMSEAFGLAPCGAAVAQRLAAIARLSSVR